MNAITNIVINMENKKTQQNTPLNVINKKLEKIMFDADSKICIDDTIMVYFDGCIVSTQTAELIDILVAAKALGLTCSIHSDEQKSKVVLMVRL